MRMQDEIGLALDQTDLIAIGGLSADARVSDHKWAKGEASCIVLFPNGVTYVVVAVGCQRSGSWWDVMVLAGLSAPNFDQSTTLRGYTEEPGYGKAQ